MVTMYLEGVLPAQASSPPNVAGREHSSGPQVFATALAAASERSGQPQPTASEAEQTLPPSNAARQEAPHVERTEAAPADGTTEGTGMRPDRAAEVAIDKLLELNGKHAEDGIPSALATALAAVSVAPPAPQPAAPPTSTEAAGEQALAPVEPDSLAAPPAGGVTSPDATVVGPATTDPSRGVVAAITDEPGKGNVTAQVPVPDGSTASRPARDTEAPERASRSKDEHEPPESSNRPVERLGKLLQDIAPHERSEVASAWNRAGGRTDWPAAIEAPTAPAEDEPIPAATEQASNAASSTPAVPGSNERADAGLNQPGSLAVAAEDGPESKGTSRSGPASETPPYAGIAAHARQHLEQAPRTPDAPAPVLDTSETAVMASRLAETVQSAVRTGDHELRLVLNPPELGQLEIHVSNGGNGLRVTVAASTSEARDLIRQHLPALVSGLEARDLRVDRAEVRHASSSSVAQDGAGAGRQANAGQGGSQGQDRRPEWTPPEWSSVAALERASARAEERRADRATSRLLDLVA